MCEPKDSRYDFMVACLCPIADQCERKCQQSQRRRFCYGREIVSRLITSPACLYSDATLSDLARMYMHYLLRKRTETFLITAQRGLTVVHTTLCNTLLVPTQL